MKIKDIIFVILVAYTFTLIDFDREVVKGLITGGVITYYLMRRFA